MHYDYIFDFSRDDSYFLFYVTQILDVTLGMFLLLHLIFGMYSLAG